MIQKFEKTESIHLLLNSFIIEFLNKFKFKIEKEGKEEEEKEKMLILKGCFNSLPFIVNDENLIKMIMVRRRRRKKIKN